MKQRHEFELVIEQKRENALHSQINSLIHLTGNSHSTLLTNNNSLHTGHLRKQKKLNNEGPDVHSLDVLMPISSYLALLGIQHLDGHTGVSGRLLLPEQPLFELQPAPAVAGGRQLAHPGP